MENIITPKVSIIIPHKDIPDLLQRCLDSIPVRDDVEVIVVDDNSNPEKVDFAHFPKWNGEHFHVFLTKEGKGPGYARNEGLDHAQGRWVVFADADDFFTDDFGPLLDEQADAEADVVFFDYINVLSDDITQQVEVRSWYRKLLSDFLKGKKNSEAVIRKDFMVPWCKLVKSDLIKRRHICFSECRWGNDLYFSAQVGCWAETIAASSTIGYVVTQRQGSLTDDFCGTAKEYRVRLAEALKCDKLWEPDYGPYARSEYFLRHVCRVKGFGGCVRLGLANAFYPHIFWRTTMFLTQQIINKMKNPIRTLIAKIPLAKPLYQAAKRWRKTLCNRREQAKLRKRPLIIRQGSPVCFGGMPLSVHWVVTTFCNFKCSYCIQARNTRILPERFCTLEQAETAIKHIASANRPSYQVNLVGGEPTRHPHLAKIIMLLQRQLGERLKRITIFSNGTFRDGQVDEILDACGQTELIFCVSVHLEYMNVNKVVELVRRLANRTCLQMKVMFHPELFDKVKIVVNTLCELRKEYPFEIEVGILREPLHSDSLDKRYTQEHFDWIRDKREEVRKFTSELAMYEPRKTRQMDSFFVEKINGSGSKIYSNISKTELEKITNYSFDMMTCCYGSNVLSIWSDGRVSGMECNVGKRDCNIFEENPFEREDWIHGVLCTKKMCGNGENYCIPKFKSAKEAGKFLTEKRKLQKQLIEEYKRNAQ